MAMPKPAASNIGMSLSLSPMASTRCGINAEHLTECAQAVPFVDAQGGAFDQQGMGAGDGETAGEALLQARCDSPSRLRIVDGDELDGRMTASSHPADGAKLADRVTRQTKDMVIEIRIRAGAVLDDVGVAGYRPGSRRR